MMCASRGVLAGRFSYRLTLNNSRGLGENRGATSIVTYWYNFGFWGFYLTKRHTLTRAPTRSGLASSSGKSMASEVPPLGPSASPRNGGPTEDILISHPLSHASPPPPRWRRQTHPQHHQHRGVSVVHIAIFALGECGKPRILD